MSERVILGGFIVLAGVIIGALVWAIASGDTGCPEGQKQEISHYIPVQTGKVTNMHPVFECVKE